MIEVCEAIKMYFDDLGWICDIKDVNEIELNAYSEQYIIISPVRGKRTLGLNNNAIPRKREFELLVTYSSPKIQNDTGYRDWLDKIENTIVDGITSDSNVYSVIGRFENIDIVYTDEIEESDVWIAQISFKGDLTRSSTVSPTVSNSYAIQTTWNMILEKPTTVAGFGLTNVYTKDEVDTLIENATESATPSLITEATANVSGHRLISNRGDYFDKDSDTIDRLLGLSVNAALIGESITVKYLGLITEPSWNWDISKAIYAGINGILTQDIPTGGISLQVAIPVDSTSLIYEKKIIVILAG